MLVFQAVNCARIVRCGGDAVTHFSGTPFENLADKVVIKLYARGASQLFYFCKLDTLAALKEFHCCSWQSLIHVENRRAKNWWCDRTLQLPASWHSMSFAAQRLKVAVG